MKKGAEDCLEDTLYVEKGKIFNPFWLRCIFLYPPPSTSGDRPGLFIFPWKEGKLYRPGSGMNAYFAWVNTLCLVRDQLTSIFLQWETCHLDSLEVIPPIVGDDLYTCVKYGGV